MAYQRSRLCLVRNVLRNVLILICIDFSSNFVWAKPPADRAKSMSDVVSSSGLYSLTDKIIILNVTNFEKTVLGSKQAWLVEFYNSFCGHCVRYAPIWKDFAADVAGWGTAVKIAVVDCVVEDNTPLCREYEIMQYPSIRFFSAHHLKGNFGTEVKKGKDSSEMRQILTGILEKEQLEGRGAHWPNITPYRSADLHNLWRDVPGTVQFSILIFKDSKGEVGADLVLDMSRIIEIQSRTVSHENEALAKLLQVSSFPSVVVISRGQERVNLIHTQDKTRYGFKIAIEAFLKLKGIEVPKIEDSGSTAIVVVTNYGDSDLQRQVNQIVSKKGDVAFLGDLEHALRYSIRHEISTRKQITGHVLKSLRDYLHIVVRYFPLSSSGNKLLKTLCNQVDGLSELTGEDWKQLLDSAEATLDAPAWTEQDEFLGCRGSQPNYRGYTCSLWTMFHVLTVQAMRANDKGGPRDVLEAILGYVTHFFGCAECSKHFQSMASDMFSEVTSHKDAVLWLWEAHNKVNKRLAGDTTEDPKYPKIQFPAVDRCPGCRDGEAWVKHQVLHYLQTVYSHSSLSVVGSSISEKSTVGNFDSLSFATGMSTFDISLYVSLCLTSAGIIALICMKFLLPRSYHKKHYVHDMFGKI